jgi:transcriptional regulator with XRE-family HTH domain
LNVEKFIAARKAAGMSQKELSDGICTQATLSRFENNGQVPSLKILIKLCNRINLPLAELFSSINVVNSQLDEQLEKAEFSLITSEFQQLAQILDKIDPQMIVDTELSARYYYLKGFEMVFNHAPFTEVLFHFDQLLMSKTADTLYQLLAYTGIGMAYAREEELEKAEVYFDKVFREVYSYQIRTTEEIWRVLNIVFHCGVFYAQKNDLETSNALLNYAIDICSENHLTYYLARAAAQLAKNAQAAGESSSVILEMIQDALAFAKINKNRHLINELNQMKKQL